MSNNEDDGPEWFRRKRSPFYSGWGFDEFERIFHQMEKMMEDELKSFTSKVPKDYVKERRLPDGSTARELGPFVYGYSMKIGPDGKPQVREFGNLKPSRFGPQVKEEREPLVDVIDSDGEIHIVAELPGVEKTEIKLHATEDSLTISVDTSHRKYFKEVVLPAKVRVREARTNYKNGVLEITLPKAGEEKEPRGEPIDIS